MDKQKSTFTAKEHIDIILNKTKKQCNMLHVTKKNKNIICIKKREDRVQCQCLLFASDLPQVVENVDDVSYSSRRFFDLGGQVDTSHGNNLERRWMKQKKEKKWEERVQ